MKKIRLIRQTTTAECGLCCISMVASYYKLHYPISYYRDKFKVGRDGISVKELYLIFQSINLTPKVYKIPLIEEFNYRNIPYVLLTKDNHFVILEKNKYNKFIVYDPSEGKKKLRLEELRKLSGGVLISIQPSANFIPFSEKIDDYRHVKMFFKGVIKFFVAVLILTALAHVLAISIPLVLEYVINSVSSGEDFIIQNILLLLLLTIILYFITYQIKNIFVIKLQAKLYQNISLFTIKHLLKLPFSYFDDRGEGNILFRMGLLTQIQEVLSGSLVRILINFVSVSVISFYLIQRYAVIIPIIIFMFISIGLFLLIINKYILNIKRSEMTKRAKVDEIQTEIITSIFQIKSSRLNDYFQKYFADNFSEFNTAFIKTQKNSNFFNLIISVYTTFFPLFVVLFFIVSYQISMGELFLLYTLVTMIMNYSIAVFTEISSVIMIKPSLFYLNDLYDEKEYVMSGSTIIKDFSELTISNLSFKYNDTSGNILYDISLNIKKGEKVALVGLSGSGKSTLIKIISGLYPVSTGRITLNGVELSEIENKFFMENVSVVPQFATVFNKTIKDNITLENENISEEDVWEALKIVELDEVVKNLPLGLNTIISNKGSNFSGGQGQRLSIARAIVKKPTLLILDEATSSLDNINESIIYRNLKKMGISLFTISHRISTIIDSDRIYVLDNGKIIEEGVHNQLLTHDGLYSKLYNEQESDE